MKDMEWGAANGGREKDNISKEKRIVSVKWNGQKGVRDELN